MALICCPGCGKEISERSIKCIHCGYILSPEPVQEERKCVECGAILSEDAEICPNCGCPVQNQEIAKEVQKVEVQSIKFSKKMKTGIIIGVIAVLILVAIGISSVFIIKAQNEKRAEQRYLEEYNSYIDNVNTVVEKMVSSGASCESVTSLAHDVWYNAIYEKSNANTNKYTRSSAYYYYDFSKAISNMYSDSTIKLKIDSIQTGQEEVNELMKKLQNPPDGLSDCYNAVVDLNEQYNSFVSLAINPTGSLASFTSSVNTVDSDFMKKYKTLQNKIPEKKTIGE